MPRTGAVRLYRSNRSILAPDVEEDGGEAMTGKLVTGIDEIQCEHVQARQDERRTEEGGKKAH